ncbi:MAG: Ig-like domain-containing protein [Salinivenus sp.]
MSHLSLRAALVLAATTLLVHCANPEAPSGGPRDTTPPTVVESRPAGDTVNVSTETEAIELTFSEYVERPTVSEALSITPSLEGRLRFDWSGQTVRIELPSSLRDSTTYIVSLGTELTDARGVSLEDPITLAFSTGPRINQGELAGRVVTPQDGAAQSGVDVFAYAAPPDTADGAAPRPLPEQPAYRTQTGSEGGFSFEYLREQPYYVVALRDNNRNRRPDAGEPVAAPPHPALPADSSVSEVPVPWVLTRVDTTGPSLQQVRPLSRQRVQLSFDEPVRLGAQRPADWRLRDSTSDARVPVTGAYLPPDRDDAVVLRTASMDSTRHWVAVAPELVNDTLGQSARPDTARFQALAQEDTTETRFRTFVPTGLSPDTADIYPLLPAVAPGVRFNQAPDSSTLRSRLTVRDTMGTERSYTLDSTDGRTFRVRPEPSLEAEEVLEIAVAARSDDPDTTYQRRFQRVASRRLGALEGRALRADTTFAVPETGQRTSSPLADTTNPPAQALVELRPEETDLPVETRQQEVAPGSTFVFRQLPDGTYSFRAVLDRNGNERWDGGQIEPYVPPEPLAWGGDAVEVRPRWTNVLPAPLRLPLLRLAPPDSGTSGPPADTTSADDP